MIMEKKTVIPILAFGLALVSCGHSDTPEVKAPTEPATAESDSSAASEVSASTTSAGTDKQSNKTTSANSSAASGTSATAKTSGQSSHRSASSQKGTKTEATKATSKRTGNAPAQPAAPPAVTSTVTTAVKNTHKQESPAFSDGSFTFTLLDTGLEVSENGQKLQTIAVDTEEMQRYLEDNNADNLAEMSVYDFDSDGNNDLFIPQQIGVLNTFGVYYHYDPSTGEFEKWDAMKEIDTFAVVDPENNTFVTNIRYTAAEHETRTYGWDENGAPVLLTMEKQYKGSDDPWDIYVDYTDYTSGSEVLVKRERLLFDDEHNVMGSEEVEIN